MRRNRLCFRTAWEGPVLGTTGPPWVTHCYQWEETINFFEVMDTNCEEEREGIRGTPETQDKRRTTSLIWSLQCSTATAKANYVLGKISRAVKVYIRSDLDYCKQAWPPYSEAGKNKLEQVEKIAVNMVAGLRGRTYEEKLKEVGLTFLHNRRVRGDMIQSFKFSMMWTK